VLLMVLLSIVSRQLGFHVPGTDAYAGYCDGGSGLPGAGAHAQAQ
jgi:hypothetical protein